MVIHFFAFFAILRHNGENGEKIDGENGKNGKNGENGEKMAASRLIAGEEPPRSEGGRVVGDNNGC